jgi:hypothetical protein
MASDYHFGIFKLFFAIYIRVVDDVSQCAVCNAIYTLVFNAQF